MWFTLAHKKERKRAIEPKEAAAADLLALNHENRAHIDRATHASETNCFIMIFLGPLPAEFFF